jgi:hypothetical protein
MRHEKQKGRRTRDPHAPSSKSNGKSTATMRICQRDKVLSHLILQARAKGLHLVIASQPADTVSVERRGER